MLHRPMNKQGMEVQQCVYFTKQYTTELQDHVNTIVELEALLWTSVRVL